MKLLVVSDLHREFDGFELPPSDALASADVIILAGDIDVGVAGIQWAQRVFADKPVVYVAGNHEFYGGRWDKTLVEMREAAADSNVHFLEDDVVVVNGVRFIGATLWTNFRLFGKALAFRAMEEAHEYMNDFRRIKLLDPGHARPGYKAPPPRIRRLFPLDARSRFKSSFFFIRDALATPFDGPTVVVTHHLPHRESVAEQFRNDLTSAAFASDLSVLMNRYQPALWIHGHTHDGMDYRVGETRVVCNPRGYPNVHQEAENERFVPDLIVEV